MDRRLALAGSCALSLLACTGDEFSSGTGSGGGATSAGPATATATSSGETTTASTSQASGDPGPTTGTGGEASSSSTETGGGAGGSGTGAGGSTGTGPDECLEGCVDADGECQPGGFATACGVQGVDCQKCEARGDCEVGVCLEGECDTQPVEDDTSCDAGTGPGSGSCLGGTCVEVDENCLNGLDDDNNDLVDCEDPACPGFVCAATPEGWEGPYAVVLSSVECPGVWGTEVRADLRTDLLVPDALCPPCSCDAGCSVSVRVEPEGTLSCNSILFDEAVLQDPNDCTRIGDDGSQAVKTPTSEADCTATYGSEVDLGDVVLSTPVTICGALQQGEGCDDPATCFPAPPSILDTPSFLCVVQDGEHEACPEGFDDLRKVAGTGVEDGRDCTTCFCEEAACSGEVRLYTTQNCTACNGSATTCGEPLIVDQVGECSGIVDPADAANLYAVWAEADESCFAPPTDLVGEATIENPVTICCAAP